MDWKAIEAATDALGDTCEHDTPGGEAVYCALLDLMRNNGHEYLHPSARESHSALPSEGSRKCKTCGEPLIFTGYGIRNCEQYIHPGSCREEGTQYSFPAEPHRAGGECEKCKGAGCAWCYRTGKAEGHREGTVK